MNMRFGKNFNLLFLAFFLSSVGDWIFRLSIPIVIYKATNSPMAMAAAYACSFAPIFLIMPFGGVIADRYNRKRILLLGDILAAGVCCLIALTIYNLEITGEWVLLPLVFVLATVTSVYHPTFQAVVPTLVESDRLPHANAMIFTSESLINVLGPLCGGLVVAFLGGTGAMLFDAVSYLISFALIALITIPTLIRTNDESSLSVWKRLSDGFTLAMSIPLLRYGTFLFVFANFATHLIVGNLIYFLATNIGLDAKDIGLTIALTGLGGVLGAILAPTLNSKFSSGPLMLTAIMIGGCIVPMLLVASDMYSVALVRGASMALESIIVVTMFTLRQRLVPADYLGRTVAITRAISFSSIPLAALVGGWLIQQTGGMSAVIWLSSSVLIVSGIWGWFTPFPNQQKKVIAA